MRFFEAPPSLLSAVALLLACTPAVTAKPYPQPTSSAFTVAEQNATLLERQSCQYPCGYYGQICCSGANQCYTNSQGQAACGSSQNAAAGQWVYWTSTEIGTTTKTQVYSSYVSAVATGQATWCDVSQNPCGSTCCPGDYYCYNSAQGVCSKNSGPTSGVAPANPLRPTTNTVITNTVSPTVTVPFETPVATGAFAGGGITAGGSSSGGLSGGAIAGIVIGVLAGIFLLILLCLFCCARAAFTSLLALFGIGKKRRRVHEETYIEEHHHTSAAGASGGRRWYGGNRPSRPKPKKSSSGLGGAAGVGAALGGLALLLGLKRKHDKKHSEKSTYTGSSYTYSDYTSSSSASSGDRRTTRHSSRR